MDRRHFLKGIPTTVALLSTPRLWAFAVMLSPEELRASYERDIAQLDRIADLPGLRAFVRAAYDTAYFRASVKAGYNSAYDYPAKVTNSAQWETLAAEVENVQSNAAARQLLNTRFLNAVIVSEPAMMALVRHHRNLLDDNRNYIYDLYDRPAPGITEEQLAAARKFTLERKELDGDYPNVEAMAASVPVRYVMPLYTRLSNDRCTDHRRSMSALAKAHKETVTEYFRKQLHWPQKTIERELTHPGTYNSSKVPRSRTCD